MKRTARHKLIDAAEVEMLARGYTATSVDQICDRAAVSKGSFYHFFDSKEELALAVLEAFHQRNRQVVEKAPTPGEDPRGHALSLVDHLVASAGSMWGGGCLLGSFALELAETNPVIAEAVSARFRAVARMLAEGFQPLADDRDERAGAAAALAEEFLVTVEGALVLARAHRDWGYVERALERFRQSVSAEFAT
jgi:TetR/AcrR family transcriptional regulator, transcriptional repressor for nem operon